MNDFHFPPSEAAEREERFHYRALPFFLAAFGAGMAAGALLSYLLIT